MYQIGGKIENKDTIVIYSGRFQPFHKGHHDVYRFLKEKYNNVFIVTTNTKSKDVKRYPFNFKEKLEIMQTLGRINKYDIVPDPVTNPYSDVPVVSYIKNLKKKLETLPEDVRIKIDNIDLNNLLILFVISEKDMIKSPGTRPRFVFPNNNNNLLYTSKINEKGLRIPSKIQKIRYKTKKNIRNVNFDNINNVKTDSKFNYILTVPTNTFKIFDKEINSATAIRNLIVTPPKGYTSINVLESLYDIPVSPENNDLYDIIIKRIKDSYSETKKKPKKKSKKKPKKKPMKKSKDEESPNEVPVRRSKRLEKKKLNVHNEAM